MIVGGMLIGPIWLLLVVPALQSFFLKQEQPELPPEEDPDAELPIFSAYPPSPHQHRGRAS